MAVKYPRFYLYWEKEGNSYDFITSEKNSFLRKLINFKKRKPEKFWFEIKYAKAKRVGREIQRWENKSVVYSLQELELAVDDAKLFCDEKELRSCRPN